MPTVARNGTCREIINNTTIVPRNDLSQGLFESTGFRSHRTMCCIAIPCMFVYMPHKLCLSRTARPAVVGCFNRKTLILCLVLIRSSAWSPGLHLVNLSLRGPNRGDPYQEEHFQLEVSHMGKPAKVYLLRASLDPPFGL